MKKYLCLVTFSVLLVGFSKAASGYEIKLTIKGVKDTIVHLVYYYGEKNHIKDSARVDSKGHVVFKGDETLPGGVYLALMPKKNYFEMIVDKEQKFSMETDTADFINNMSVKGSSANQLFYDYLRFVSAKGKMIGGIREEMEAAKGDAEKTKELKAKQVAIDTEVKDYKNKFIEQHPDELLTKIFLASWEPEIPEAPMLPGGKKDSTFAYRYFKAHFFDKIDMKDDRLLRSPVFGAKIKTYMEKLTPQIPDSIIKSADYIIGLTSQDGEIFKYLVYTITNTYEKSNIMCMDAVFTSMARKYYLSGKAFWVDSAQTVKIKDRVEDLEPCLCGKTANNMTGLLKSDFHPVSLKDIKTTYTLVYFWDPSCGHCQKVTPKLSEFYDKHHAELDLEVLGIYIEADTTEWFKYIKEKDLKWINAADLTGKARFRDYYDIYSTPVIYILDKNKKIIAKKIDVENIEDFLKNYSKRQIN